MSLSYGIVQEHGGQISVRTELGRGTALDVEIPVRADQAAQSDDVPPPAMESNGGGKMILVVDDEEIILGLLQEILTSEGHRVDTARNGLEALHKIRRKSYDMVMSDLRMPGMDGEELYEKVAKEVPELLDRMVFTTGDIVSPGIQEFLKRTGNRFLSKPFSLDEVLQTLSHLDDRDPPGKS